MLYDFLYRELVIRVDKWYSFNDFNLNYIEKEVLNANTDYNK